MKKIITILVVLLSSATFINAQEKPLSISVKGGVDLSKMSIKNNDSDAKFGYRFGVVGEYQLKNDFFIQSSLEFLSKGTKNKTRLSGDLNNDGIDEDLATGDLRWNSIYLELPILLGYNINVTNDFKIKFMAGPYFAYGVGGKVKMETMLSAMQPSGQYEFIQEKASVKTFSTLKRFDMGLMGAVGADYKKYQFTLGYEYGLTNISRGSNSIHNMNAFATVGYQIF